MPVSRNGKHISISKDQTAVVLVDFQGDFTLYKNGSLAVEGTDEAYADKVITDSKKMKKAGYKLFATKDYHPPGHVSFYSSHPGKKVLDIINIEDRTQVLWPPHCVAGTKNADILMDEGLFSAIVRKGMDPGYDSYSGFHDDAGKKTGLDDILKSHGVNTLVMYGLATDFCVKATALDAVELGYRVILIKDLCRGVAKETTRSALEAMESAGVEFVNSSNEVNNNDPEEMNK